MYDFVFLSALIVQATFLSLFVAKHLIADFYLQPPYMWKNKGTYGHMGGIAHSGIHALFTGIVIFLANLSLISTSFLFTVPVLTKLGVLIIVAMLFDFTIHYHMDWFKMFWCKKQNYTPEHPKFWHWLGIDQFVHMMTYIVLSFILAYYMPALYI